jgi:WD40 repeat protein
VRQKESIIKFQHHRQEICGLKWCPNGRYLASGSNDNTVCVWDFHQWYSNGSMNTINSASVGSLSSLLPPADNGNTKINARTKPLWHFKEHKAAVKVIFKYSILFIWILFKAIAWCPWEGSKVLATGGGHSDGNLCFWNNSNGTCQQAINTESQV